MFSKITIVLRKWWLNFIHKLLMRWTKNKFACFYQKKVVLASSRKFHDPPLLRKWGFSVNESILIICNNNSMRAFRRFIAISHSTWKTIGLMTGVWQFLGIITDNKSFPSAKMTLIVIHQLKIPSHTHKHTQHISMPFTQNE